jgi:E3 SUMO-protein ligase PIAS1
MKKKPGTAPPPDLGKNLRLQNNASNRIEIVYVNSQNPIPSKVCYRALSSMRILTCLLYQKYYMVVMLVEVTTVEQLIDRLRKGKYRSSNEILGKSKLSAT